MSFGVYNEDLNYGKLNNFALSQYKKYKVFETITNEDITILFDFYRPFFIDRDKYEIDQLRYAFFILKVYNMVKITFINNETKYSDVCDNIIKARKTREEAQGENLLQISKLDLTKLYSYWNPKSWGRYNITKIEDLENFNEDHVKLHIVWMAYWDLQTLKPHIFSSIDTVRALTDCDGVSLAVNKEILEHDIYSESTDSTDSVIPWFVRIKTKPVGSTQVIKIKNKSKIEYNSDPEFESVYDSESVSDSNYDIVKIKFDDYIKEIESRQYNGCNKSYDKYFRKSAYVDGEIVFSHNKVLVDAKVPASTFLKLGQIQENTFSSIDQIYFVSSRIANNLNFRIDTDPDNSYRLSMQIYDSFVILKYCKESKKWIDAEISLDSLSNSKIRVQGILYSILCLPPIKIPNRFHKSFEIIIKHRYTYSNYPMYASPVAGVPYDMEVLFPHNCTFVIDGYDKKILNLTFVANPSHELNSERKVPYKVPYKEIARYSEVFLPNQNVISGGSKSRNFKTTFLLAITSIIIAFLPRSL